jgi:hypothetical protein
MFIMSLSRPDFWSLPRLYSSKINAQLTRSSPSLRSLKCLARTAPVPYPSDQLSTSLDRFLKEHTLDSGFGEIYGIPRDEWLQIQGPVRYMGNEFGAVHKSFEEQVRI